MAWLDSYADGSHSTNRISHAWAHIYIYKGEREAVHSITLEETTTTTAVHTDHHLYSMPGQSTTPLEILHEKSNCLPQVKPAVRLTRVSSLRRKSILIVLGLEELRIQVSRLLRPLGRSSSSSVSNGISSRTRSTRWLFEWKWGQSFGEFRWSID